MISSRDICKQINNITTFATQCSLCNKQEWATEKNGCISWSGNNEISEIIRNIPYKDSYDMLLQKKAYNMQLLDGALIQMQYLFNSKGLQKHRLAYFPSPTLIDFSSFEKEYEDDDEYLDIISQNIVHVPIRFDYDKDNAKELVHPESHLTLGQYKNCRIPVIAPIVPSVFMHFIFENFYSSIFKKNISSYPFDKERFDSSIKENEKKIIHIAFS